MTPPFPIVHRLGDDLVVGYALDRPDHYEVVLQRHLGEFAPSCSCRARRVATGWCSMGRVAT